ncbi:unnamed protein product [Cuscuta europaea]|uniref:RRM domain-containing protein n=1 Tax=Cuscuta europaea TaxID=41803 RepID=A0A9P0YL04_CUSEU|nr:unnamed protein product [Cuscuta europaea]
MGASWYEITDEMFRSFHKIDRELYSILVFELGHEHFESVEILALWIWLERSGFKNVVQKILSLPINVINELAVDAITCLKCIKDATSPCEVGLTQRVIGKQFSLRFLHENRVKASRGVQDAVAEVCAKALKDLVLVPEEERTMFATFSKGYPVSEGEVRRFFTKVLGNCIECIHMQAVKPQEEQPLYARVVFFDPTHIDLILNGEHKAKFTINGKHVWMRRFVPPQKH